VSQHPFDYPGYKVVVGWDPPLRTFFSQTYSRTQEHDHPQCRSTQPFVRHSDDACLCDLYPEVWVGVRPGEIQTVEQLQLVMGVMKIPEGILRLLREDQVNNR
jgi:hypothetical protein